MSVIRDLMMVRVIDMELTPKLLSFLASGGTLPLYVTCDRMWHLRMSTPDSDTVLTIKNRYSIND